jgi:hypothetical protein
MSPPQSEKLADKADQVCKHFQLSPEGRKLLRPGQAPPAFLGLLFANDLFRDAIYFLAYLMPKREAVWWGSLCVWQQSRPEPPAEVGDALEAAVRWVREPNEANRRAAQEAGERAGAATPAGALALGVFWSGGSLSRADLPAVPPPAELTQSAVASAVLTAAAQGDSAQMSQRYRQFLHLGIEVANQKNRWQ